VGSGTLYPVGVASGKTPTPNSKGVKTCPGREWQGIVTIIKIIVIRLSGGFELITDQEEHGGEGGEG